MYFIYKSKMYDNSIKVGKREMEEHYFKILILRFLYYM